MRELRGMSDDERCPSPSSFKAPASLPPGVRKEIIKEPDAKSFSQPSSGDEVKIDYKGCLEDGTEFDSSHSRDAPLVFTLGKEQVIKGLDLGVATMHKGEVAKFMLQPEFGYGEEGSPPKIPPDAPLVFTVELISWVEKDDLFGDGSVIKSLIEEGTGFDKPKKRGEVRIALKVTAADGTVTKDGPDCDYTIGSGEHGPLSKVLDKAILGMRGGEKCSLKCAAASAYGDVSIDLALEELYDVVDVSIMKDRSVLKKKLKDGEGYERAEDMGRVTLRVESVVADGVSQLDQPKDFTFIVGSGEYCDALECACSEMRKGERALLTCTSPQKSCGPELGAATQGSKRTAVTLELCDFKKAGDFSNLCAEDKLTVAGMRKDDGAALVKKQRFELALAKYKKVESDLNDTHKWSDDFKRKAAELKNAAEVNKSLCYLKLGDNLMTLTVCNSILRRDPHNVKAMFRRAKAHWGRGEAVEAARDLERVLDLDPNNAEAKQLLPYTMKAQKKADAQGKNLFSKMCDGLGKMPARKDPKDEAPRDPSPPRERSDVVNLSFRMDLKLEEPDVLCVYGSCEPLGSWDESKCVELTPLPQKWEPPVGSGREPPRKYTWEALVGVKETEELVEYRYLIRDAEGKTLRIEDGNVHKCHVSGMGDTRQRLTDSWRGS